MAAAEKTEKAAIGLVGLAVMGENLALNMESKGFRVCVFNRTADTTRRFVGGRARGKNIVAAASLADLASRLEKPRKVMLMVKAGKPVDDLVEALVPLLEPGDIIIDGGNAHFPDSARRAALLESKGLLFVGAGVSGGGEGALRGPCIMPGGSEAAWPAVKRILQAIAARADGVPCCDWIGGGGAGHFVKMVHNGIEYGDMQLICEAYHLLRDAAGCDADAMRDVFAEWNRGELGSYLVEITADILGRKDADGGPLLDKILDAAGQKGTGKWAVMAALDGAAPLTLIGEAVFARRLSAARDERLAAAGILSGPASPRVADGKAFADDIRRALLAAKIVSYAQGCQLLRAGAGAFGWDLDCGGIALMWRGGCIIRSAFLGDIKAAYDRNPRLANLMLDERFKAMLDASQAGWRRVCAEAILRGIPAPAMCSALAYYDGCRCRNLPANLLQAQRDYFGAHTYERIDAPRGAFFHTDWTGLGGGSSPAAGAD